MTETAVAEQDSDLFRDASEWLARFDGDDSTAEDQQRFDAWRRLSPAHDQAFRDVRATWAAPEFAVAISTVEPAPSMTPSRHSSPACRSRNWIPAVAAAAMVIVTTLWFVSSDLLTIMQSDYRTTPGEQRTVQLTDHSSIILNTNTAITAHLEGPTRRIHLLTGEALFRVNRDLTAPLRSNMRATSCACSGPTLSYGNGRIPSSSR